MFELPTRTDIDVSQMRPGFAPPKRKGPSLRSMLSDPKVLTSLAAMFNRDEQPQANPYAPPSSGRFNYGI